MFCVSEIFEYLAPTAMYTALSTVILHVSLTSISQLPRIRAPIIPNRAPMKKVYVLELSCEFDSDLIDIRVEDVNTGQEYSFSTLSEFQQWLHVVSRRKQTKRAGSPEA